MWKARFDNPWALIALSGAAVFLAFPKYELPPLSVLFGVFFLRLVRHATSKRSAFVLGFLVSFVIMLGGFYWVTYVIHVFGYLPWAVAVLLFLGFCGFGALNFPIFAAVSFAFRRWESSRYPSALFAIVYPALFVAIEWAVPKLFPWQIGHCLYKTPWLNQIAEITGTTFLTFLILSLGTTTYAAISVPGFRRRWFLFPVSLTALSIGFSLYRLEMYRPAVKKMRVAIIQANVGSLDKVVARRGSASKRKVINDLYVGLTERVIGNPDSKPELIIWPETALAYRLDGVNPLAAEIADRVQAWNIPLITGAYAPGVRDPSDEMNAAYLLEPISHGRIRYDVYGKNVLLAFGEYMPFGEWFPSLYRRFPQVSHFERGTTQKALELSDGTRIGVTICYEMILPEFVRHVAKSAPHLFVNLTNDSWFGPTSEPYLHGAISVFRAIEHRVPVVRSTNTGTSFFVDMFGRVRERTGVYEEAVLVEDLLVPSDALPTFYGRFGEWFVAVCIGIVLVFMMAVKRGGAP